MSTKIIGVTVGTPMKASKIDRELKPVKTVNGVFPDENGDVAIQAVAGSGIHVGAEPPTDENIKVWVDTDEEAEMGGANIDVVATPGQMIVVKSVDENGKPTEWEAIDIPEGGGSGADESAEAAAVSASNAKTSETNAKTFADNAKVSETNAKTSETNAKTAETNAASHKAAAELAADNAAGSYQQAKDCASNANAARDETFSARNEAQAARDAAKEAADRAEAAGSGGANIDVVAVPGQMLIVKAVDENGKPTEWETAERTHWKEYAEVATILEETTLNLAWNNNKSDSFKNVEIHPGKTYKVMYNGVPYIRTAQTAEYGEYTGVWFGTIGALQTQKFPDFGDPFLVFGTLGSTSVAVYAREDGALFSITEVEEVYHTIDPQYIQDLYGEATVDVMPESRLTSYDAPGDFAITSAIDVNVGDKCVVKWNGVAYEGIVQPVEIEEGITCGCLGNIGAMIGEAGTSEPFVVVIIPKDLVAAVGAGAQIISLEGLTEVTVSIGKFEVVKIPEKYLPNCVVKTVNGISPDENGNVEVVGGGYGRYTEIVTTEEVASVSLDFPYFEHGGVFQIVAHIFVPYPASGTNNNKKGKVYIFDKQLHDPYFMSNASNFCSAQVSGILCNYDLFATLEYADSGLQNGRAAPLKASLPNNYTRTIKITAPPDLNFPVGTKIVAGITGYSKE